MITDLMGVEDFGYEEVRERRLERTGVISIQAGVQIFRGWMNNFTETDQREQVRQLFQLCERYFAKCITKADIFVYLVKALYRLVLPPSDQVVVDGRQIFTQTDIFDVVNTIQTLADSRSASQKDRTQNTV